MTTLSNLQKSRLYDRVAKINRFPKEGNNRSSYKVF